MTMKCLLPLLLFASFLQPVSAQSRAFFEDIKMFKSPPPNIVLIMADDLGFSDLGCYGSEIETPNLDALAQDGLRFTQFYNTAKCHSSRVSLLTGLYADQAGGESLSRGATIAEVLAPANYHTMMVGKWHLSKQPTDFGFHRYWGTSPVPPTTSLATKPSDSTGSRGQFLPLTKANPFTPPMSSLTTRSISSMNFSKPKCSNASNLRKERRP